jgi:hypothetical protein
MDVTVPLRKPTKYKVMLPQIVEMAEAGSGVDRISRVLGIAVEVIRDAPHLHRTGKRPPGRRRFCRLGRSPRPIWPRSPRRCDVVLCGGSARSGSSTPMPSSTSQSVFSLPPPEKSSWF